MEKTPYVRNDFAAGNKHKPKKKIKLTSLLFTIGLCLMAINLLMEATNLFSSVQGHTLGGAVVAFATSIAAQVLDA